MQRAVEKVHGDALLPVRTPLPEERVFIRKAPPADGDPGRDGEAALEGMGDPEGETAEPAAVTVLAGLDMFEVELGPERRPGAERIGQAGADTGVGP